MVVEKLKTIKNRIYGDYLMPSRLNEYEQLIKKLLIEGYEHITIREYQHKLKRGTLGTKKYFVNRHDIDTDVTTAKAFFEIEKKYGVYATYYFRLSTLDFNFMKTLEEYGSEASYHYEEIASYCKQKHIKSKNELLTQIEQVREIFIINVKMIEKRLEKKLITVCSHGDFINRKLGLSNYIIMNSKTLRETLALECETYDKDLLGSFDIYISDKPYPKIFEPKDIFSYIGKVHRICMLTHPRQWQTNFIENTKDNFVRFYEGLIW